MGQTNMTARQLMDTKPFKVSENTLVNSIPVVCYVVKAGLIFYVKAFIARKFSFNRVDIYGNTPLHYAASTKRSKLVSLFVEMGLSTCLTNKRGQTPLMIAILNKRYDHIPMLKDAMFVRDAQYNGPLHHAILEEDVRLLHALVLNTPPLPKTWVLTFTHPKDYHLNYFPQTESLPALSLAISYMKFTMVKELIQLGADKNASYSNQTPLSILNGIARTLRYGGTFKTDRRTQKDVKRMWGVLEDDTNINRTTYNFSDKHTGLLSGNCTYI